jgi:hypothetical protein
MHRTWVCLRVSTMFVFSCDGDICAEARMSSLECLRCFCAVMRVVCAVACIHFTCIVTCVCDALVDWSVRLTLPESVTLTHIVLTSLRNDDSYLPLRFLLHCDDATIKPKSKPAASDLVRDEATHSRAMFAKLLSYFNNAQLFYLHFVALMCQLMWGL